jgi:hypothetical protein
MKTPTIELFYVPDGLTVVPFFFSFNVRCDLCDPRRTKAINWHPDKRPAANRCADYISGHLQTTHRIKITPETALDFVNRASLQKATKKSDEIADQPFRFAPPRLRCRL